MATNSGRGVSTQCSLQGEGRALRDEAECSDGGEGTERHKGEISEKEGSLCRALD